MASVWDELKRRNVVRVAIAYVIIAWLILQIGDTLGPALRLPDAVNTALAFFLILGFPLAVFFAWAFELTPEGLKKEKDVDRSQSVTHITGRKIDYLVIAALVLALGFFAVDKFALGPSRQAAEPDTVETVDKSIAVLAFADLSPEGDQEYFSDGISEELLNVLAKLPGLRVAARTSSFQFKGENRDVIDIGKQLNVALVLEGSVRKAGLQLRITAQLVDARSGFHLWSETYDRELKNVFAVQDEISAAIVEALKEHLGLQVATVPRVIAAANTEAHEAYLRGRYLAAQRTVASIEGAVRAYEKAIALDPDYALAHAELAIAFILQIRAQLGTLTNPEAVAKAAPHAELAMTLDPNLAEAHAATGFAVWIEGNLEEGITHLRRAVQINPNYSIVYTWMGLLLAHDLGRYVESFEMFETSVRLDPLSRPAIWNYVEVLIERNRLAEAEREIEKIAPIHPSTYVALRGLLTSVGGKWTNTVLATLDSLRIEPDSSRSWNRLSWQFAAIGLAKEALTITEHPPWFTLSWLGKHEDAITIADAHLTEDPNFPELRHALGMALAGAGDYERARPILEDLWQKSGGRITPAGQLQFSGAAALIIIRRTAGEEDDIDGLITAIKDNVHRYREAGITRGPDFNYSVDYEEGLAAYLVGERERGLALIARASEDGMFIPQKQAYLQTLYDDPNFTPVREMQEARQISERERFLAIVCTDNPYAAVWQPAEGTCERFAAVGEN